ncbi:hypothetical protein [uncultured Agrococcus sp.]|uniref:hypothetical protein n=1 Tax=uncultured Agrococcus sp. TaxID=382258 RepID=UPI0025F37E65|nr:hypothetical protein [uncultured Agrococcus sp.]
MYDATQFGPLIQRYRTTVSVWHVLWQLSIGPIIAVAAGVTGLVREETGSWWWVTAAAAGIALFICAGIVVLWSTSAFLDVYAYGIVVGRRFPGSPVRHVWFSEVHPASIRVFDDIDSVRSLPYRSLSSRWHFSGGADLAVTFVGPDRGTTIGTYARPFAPGEGYVIFGSQRAEEIAHLIRAGLERSGYPPEVAYQTASFGVQRLRGVGGMALGSIPGARAGWQPATNSSAQG